MDTKRRLRIVWTALCLLAAAFLVLMIAGQPTPEMRDAVTPMFLTAAVGAVITGFAPFASSRSSAVGMLWLGTMGAALVIDALTTHRSVMVAVAIAAAGWAAIKVVAWVISPAIRSRSGA